MFIDTSPLSEKLRNLCWVFTEWILACNKHVVVPEISLDGKALENIFGMPLLEITGRRIAGSFCVFEIGFLLSDSIENVGWMLESF